MVFGNSPNVKVVDFFLENSLFSFTLMEIHKDTKAGYATVKYLLPKLLKNKIVIIDKKVGKANLYKLNSSHKMIKHLLAFDTMLIMGLSGEKVKSK